MQLKTIGESANVTKVIEQVINANNHLGKGLNDNIVLGQKLANATSSYSVEAVKMAISQSSLNKEQIKAILSQQGLRGELLETTTAELEQAIATNTLSVSQKEGTTGIHFLVYNKHTRTHIHISTKKGKNSPYFPTA